MTTTYGQISVSILEMDSHGQIKMKVENFKQKENLKDFVYQELFNVDNVSIELQLVEEILDDDQTESISQVMRHLPKTGKMAKDLER